MEGSKVHDAVYILKLPFHHWCGGTQVGSEFVSWDSWQRHACLEAAWKVLLLAWPQVPSSLGCCQCPTLCPKESLC